MNIKNNQKGFSVQGIIIVIALIIIAVLAYYMGTKNVVAPKGDDIVVNATTTVTDAKCANGATNYPHCNADLPQSSTWKTYTDSKNGYSFQYPAKLSLVTTAGTVSLSHTIPFENRDGGCDMKGDSELSKTLGDFGLSIKVVSGEVKPSYVDGTYSKGVLNGNWAYMGAEGCGQTSYYFPIAGGKTLVITKNEIQILSDVVSPDVKAKVLAVHGVISQQEAKLIVDQILSSFKFTSSVINSTQSSLTVLSPNGNENWVKGSTKTIRWSNPSTQIVSGVGGPQDEVSIFINSQPTDTAPLAKTIVTGLSKNATSYDWNVGSNVENTVLNGPYYIKVCRQSFRCDWSDTPFTITN